MPCLPVCLKGHQLNGMHGSCSLQIVERKFFDNWNEFEDNKLRMELEMQPLKDDAEVDFHTPAGAKGSGFLPRVSLPCLLELRVQGVKDSGLQAPRAQVIVPCLSAEQVHLVISALASTNGSCLLP